MTATNRLTSKLLALSIALVEDLRPPVAATFVRNGVSIMPPFCKTEISDADLAALAAYLAR